MANPAVDPAIMQDAAPSPSAAGSARLGLGANVRLTASFDDLTGEYGLQVYREMLRMPAVDAGLFIMRGLILGAQPTITPAAVEGREDEAQQMADFVTAALESMEEPLDLLLEPMMEALATASRPAEISWETRTVDGSPRLMIERIAPKMREHVVYIEDRFGRRLGYQARAGELGMWSHVGTESGPVLPKEKFFVLDFGGTLLRSAYNHYRFSQRILPQFYRFLDLMASPSVVGILPENVTGGIFGEARPGESVSGVTRKTPEQIMLEDLQKFQSASALALAHGSDVKLVEAQGNGEAFLNAFDWCDRQILMAILGLSQVAVEAKHSNKANSDSAVGVLGKIVRGYRRRVAHQVNNQIIKPLVRFNFPEMLDVCPVWSLTDALTEEFFLVADAVARLESAGYLSPEMRPALDALMGLGGRDLEQIEAEREARAQAALESAKLMNPLDSGA